MTTIEQTPCGIPSGCPVAHDFDPFKHENWEFWKAARQHRPVFYHQQLDAYVVTRYKDCERVLRAKDDEISAKPALEPNVPLTPAAGKILMESGFQPGHSDTFDVRRENARKHMTFGTGLHACLGKDLARMEIKWILEELTRRLPHLELIPGQTYQYSPNTSQRGPEHVLVRWDPAHNPLPEDRP